MTDEQRRRLARAHAAQLRTLATLVEDSSEPITDIDHQRAGVLTYEHIVGEISRRLYAITQPRNEGR